MSQSGIRDSLANLLWIPERIWTLESGLTPGLQYLWSTLLMHSLFPHTQTHTSDRTTVVWMPLNHAFFKVIYPFTKQNIWSFHFYFTYVPLVAIFSTLQTIITAGRFLLNWIFFKFNLLSLPCFHSFGRHMLIYAFWLFWKYYILCYNRF